jgi:hypothetical protein
MLLVNPCTGTGVSHTNIPVRFSAIRSGTTAIMSLMASTSGSTKKLLTDNPTWRFRPLRQRVIGHTVKALTFIRDQHMLQRTKTVWRQWFPASG